ncbi:unnamed protein product, partial [Closterium sp. Naga37s-1]
MGAIGAWKIDKVEHGELVCRACDYAGLPLEGGAERVATLSLRGVQPLIVRKGRVVGTAGLPEVRLRVSELCAEDQIPPFKLLRDLFEVQRGEARQHAKWEEEWGGKVDWANIIKVRDSPALPSRARDVLLRLHCRNLQVGVRLRFLEGVLCPHCGGEETADHSAPSPFFLTAPRIPAIGGYGRSRRVAVSSILTRQDGQADQGMDARKAQRAAQKSEAASAARQGGGVTGRGAQMSGMQGAVGSGEQAGDGRETAVQRPSAQHQQDQQQQQQLEQAEGARKASSSVRAVERVAAARQGGAASWRPPTSLTRMPSLNRASGFQGLGLGSGIQGLGSGFQGLGSGFQGLGSGIQGLGSGIQGRASAVRSRLQGGAMEAGSRIQGGAYGVGSSLQDTAAVVGGVIQGRAVEVGGAIQGKAVAVGSTIQDTAVVVGGAIQDKAVAVSSTIQDTAVVVGGAIQDTAVVVGSRIQGKAVELQERAVEVGTSIQDRAVEVSSSLQDRAVLLQGKAVEVSSTLQDVVSEVGQVVTEVGVTIQEKQQEIAKVVQHTAEDVERSLPPPAQGALRTAGWGVQAVVSVVAPVLDRIPVTRGQLAGAAVVVVLFIKAVEQWWYQFQQDSRGSTHFDIPERIRVEAPSPLPPPVPVASTRQQVDVRRKEPMEWVNMLLRKTLCIYRTGLAPWMGRTLHAGACVPHILHGLERWMVGIVPAGGCQVKALKVWPYKHTPLPHSPPSLLPSPLQVFRIYRTGLERWMVGILQAGGCKACKLCPHTLPLPPPPLQVFRIYRTGLERWMVGILQAGGCKACKLCPHTLPLPPPPLQVFRIYRTGLERWMAGILQAGGCKACKLCPHTLPLPPPPLQVFQIYRTGLERWMVGILQAGGCKACKLCPHTLPLPPPPLQVFRIYRTGLERWMVGILQPLIDETPKPRGVQRVRIKQFFLGDEPPSLRSIERRTSRRGNDLQYHVGVRYTGGMRMLLEVPVDVSMGLSAIPLTVPIPVGVRNFDVDAEVWVRLKLIPVEPWVGALTWAFVSMPKVKLTLAPFRVVNLMEVTWAFVAMPRVKLPSASPASWVNAVGAGGGEGGVMGGRGAGDGWGRGGDGWARSGVDSRMNGDVEPLPFHDNIRSLPVSVHVCCVLAHPLLVLQPMHAPVAIPFLPCTSPILATCHLIHSPPHNPFLVTFLSSFPFLVSPCVRATRPLYPQPQHTPTTYVPCQPHQSSPSQWPPAPRRRSEPNQNNSSSPKHPSRAASTLAPNPHPPLLQPRYPPRYLQALLTEELPARFLRPNSKEVDLLKDRPLPPDPAHREFREGQVAGGTLGFAGELQVTVIAAQRVINLPLGDSDPYVVLELGQQVARSKRNSETSLVGPAGYPIWNQDFVLLVLDPTLQRLSVKLRGSLGLFYVDFGHGSVRLDALQDTVPTDVWVPMRLRLPVGQKACGRVKMRLTYKAFVAEDDQQDVETFDQPYSEAESDGEGADALATISRLRRFVADVADSAAPPELMRILENVRVGEIPRVVDLERLSSDVAKLSDLARALEVALFKDVNRLAELPRLSDLPKMKEFSVLAELASIRADMERLAQAARALELGAELEKRVKVDLSRIDLDLSSVDLPKWDEWMAVPRRALPQPKDLVERYRLLLPDAESRRRQREREARAEGGEEGRDDDGDDPDGGTGGVRQRGGWWRGGWNGKRGEGGRRNEGNGRGGAGGKRERTGFSGVVRRGMKLWRGESGREGAEEGKRDRVDGGEGVRDGKEGGEGGGDGKEGGEGGGEAGGREQASGGRKKIRRVTPAVVAEGRGKSAVARRGAEGQRAEGVEGAFEWREALQVFEDVWGMMEGSPSMQPGSLSGRQSPSVPDGPVWRGRARSDAPARPLRGEAEWEGGVGEGRYGNGRAGMSGERFDRVGGEGGGKAEGDRGVNGNGSVAEGIVSADVDEEGASMAARAAESAAAAMAGRGEGWISPSLQSAGGGVSGARGVGHRDGGRGRDEDEQNAGGQSGSGAVAGVEGRGVGEEKGAGSGGSTRGERRWWEVWSWWHLLAPGGMWWGLVADAQNVAVLKVCIGGSYL